jgi:hypothetical protein
VIDGLSSAVVQSDLAHRYAIVPNGTAWRPARRAPDQTGAVRMPKYYLNIHNGLGFVQDEEGCVLDDSEAAREQAIRGARSIISAEVLAGTIDLRGKIEILAEDGSLALIVPFSDAVTICE